MPTAKLRNRKTCTRNPQQTRARILRAATMLFAAKGPDATTVDEIAARASVNKRMLYHYFGDKRGLYLSVLTEAYERIGQISMEIIGKAKDVRELLEGILREYFSFLQQNPEFTALLNWENSARARGLKSIALPNPAKLFVAALHRALDKERSNFNIHEDIDIKYVLMACLALCGYYFTNRHTLSVVFDIDMDDPTNMERWLEHVRGLILDGILNKNS